MQHLMFQLFTAGPGFDTEGGLWRTIQRLEPHMTAVERRAAGIVERIGTTGSHGRKLGIVVGPLCLDHTDGQLRDIVDAGFEIAASLDIAIGFHIDDAKFWFRRSDLWNQPENVEASDWEGTLNTGQYLNWGEAWKLAPQACFNAQSVMQEANRVAQVIAGRLTCPRPGNRLAAVFAGWETAIGPDYETGRALGYRALANLGFSRDNPPASIPEEIESIVRDWIDVWAGTLALAGVPREKIFSHVVPGVVPFETALIANGLPGFTMYNGTAAQAEVLRMLAESGHAGGWAVAEGADVNIEAALWRPGDDPDAYLNELFAHGASVVNIFGWGIGGLKNPFRRAAESEEAIAAYRRWLGGDV